jgi:hypothetical protein
VFGTFDIIFASVMIGIACESVLQVLIGSIGFSFLIVILASAGINPYMQAVIRRNLDSGQNQFL